MALLKKISIRALPVFVLAFFSWINVQAQKNNTDTFSVHHFYTTDRGRNPEQFFSAENDSLIKYAGNHKLKPGVRVIGFHPAWLGTVYTAYNYTLLTHIIYFSFEVNPNTGHAKTMNGWDTTQLPVLAKKENPACKVLLAVSCFGKDAQTLLDNNSAQQQLISDLKILVTTRKADGVCIDFEEMPESCGPKFTAFIAQLNTVFKSSGLEVTLTLPALDPTQQFDVKALNSTVDFYIMMGYDYFGGFSKKTGPVAPLNNKSSWGVNASVSTSVQTYLKRGVTASSLVLGLPYYGALWETPSLNVPDQAQKFLGYRPYNYFGSATLKKYKVDTTLQSLYLAFNTAQDSSNRQCWIDGVRTLGKKYDYILKQKLGGVAVWALGFDSGTNDLWDLLRVKFAVDTSAASKPKPPVIPDASTFEEVSAFVQTYKTAVLICAFMVLLTLLLVLIKTIGNNTTVAALKTKGIYYQFLICVFVIMASIMLVMLYFGFKFGFKTSAIVTGILLLGTPLLKNVHFLRKKNQP